MSAAHTKGLRECPFCGDPMHFDVSEVLCHSDGDNCLIGDLAWHGGESFVTAWNTRADASADLLEALEWIAANYENGHLNHVDFRVEAKHRADAALTKATGVSPSPERGR